MTHLLVFPLISCWVQVSGPKPSPGSWIVIDGSERRSGLVGGLTLEIYLVHYAVRDSSIVARMPFPGNVAAILLGSVALAIPLARGADWIRGQSKRDPRRGHPALPGKGGGTPLLSTRRSIAREPRPATSRRAGRKALSALISRPNSACLG